MIWLWVWRICFGRDCRSLPAFSGSWSSGRGCQKRNMLRRQSGSRWWMPPTSRQKGFPAGHLLPFRCRQIGLVICKGGCNRRRTFTVGASAWSLGAGVSDEQRRHGTPPVLGRSGATLLRSPATAVTVISEVTSPAEELKPSTQLTPSEHPTRQSGTVQRGHLRRHSGPDRRGSVTGTPYDGYVRASLRYRG